MDIDSNDLERFVLAQRPVYQSVLEELRRGRKTTHWMWFVFPQLRGLGRSAMAITYGLQSAEEAARYWRHEVLGQRLKECTELALGAGGGKSLHDIFGSPDDMKFCSCMTLFANAVPNQGPFEAAISSLCDGRRDARTLELLGAT
jgi:uncharacterized protein (DUF1810 family)